MRFASARECQRSSSWLWMARSRGRWPGRNDAFQPLLGNSRIFYNRLRIVLEARNDLHGFVKADVWVQPFSCRQKLAIGREHMPCSADDSVLKAAVVVGCPGPVRTSLASILVHLPRDVKPFQEWTILRLPLDTAFARHADELQQFHIVSPLLVAHVVRVLVALSGRPSLLIYPVNLLSHFGRRRQARALAFKQILHAQTGLQVEQRKGHDRMRNAKEHQAGVVRVEELQVQRKNPAVLGL
mmetsp:Transcript_16947/g.64540  ORF Transcript_16947/g.64540 Transcript_16947/m.64540 type:complete len:241 (-) Transcript_16947:939-1661(-)